LLAAPALAEEASGAGPAAARDAPAGAWTVYAGRMSSEKAWQDILLGPTHVSFTDTDLAVLAHSRALPWSLGGFAWEVEGQVAKYRGGQDHWEFNVPVVARWTRFPWSARVATAASFALGLSYATEIPPVEVELEGESQRLLVYWFIELAAGPPEAAWSVVTRLHHRSVAFGLMGEEGGMNAVTVGLRWEF
jgi:hypothetical protein